MLRVGVLISGGGTNLQALIDNVEKGQLDNVTIEVVISSKKDAYGLERARDHGIRAVEIIKKDYSDPGLFEEALLDELDRNNIDLVVLAGYLQIVPSKVVEAYKNRIINIHPSLIPAFCGNGFYGLKVHEEAIKRGVKITGATVHFVDEGTDTGPIIMQKAVELKDDDTPESLQLRVMEEAEWVILPEAVGLIAKGKVVVNNNVVRIKE
ncbi:MAG TPA: phosphoribosylglycinamide formyltransferase [Clostridiales bacterium]|nr:phosphoribosylglycinamide formyltransferase [Clostridiales bacterium]